MGQANRRTVLMMLCIVAVAGHVRLTFGQQTPNPASAANAIDRGRYLVTVQDCNGCHTPFNKEGEPDLSRMLRDILKV